MKERHKAYFFTSGVALFIMLIALSLIRYLRGDSFFAISRVGYFYFLAVNVAALMLLSANVVIYLLSHKDETRYSIGNRNIEKLTSSMIMLGVGLSIVIFSSAYESHRDFLRQTFRNEARERVMSLNTVFRSVFSDVKATALYVSNSEYVKADEFRRYAEGFLKEKRELHALILVIDEGDGVYRVKYMEPLQGHEDLIGKDVGGFGGRREAYMLAAGSGARALVLAPPYASHLGPQDAVSAIAPVTYNGRRKGYIEGITALSVIIEKAMAGTPYGMFSMEVRDTGYYGIINRFGTPEKKVGTQGLVYNERFESSMLAWDITVRPGSLFFKKYPPRTAWFKFVISLLITAFSVAVIRFFTLSEINAAAGRERINGIILDSIEDGVIAADTGGSVAMMNRTAEKLTGWTMQQAKGRNIADVYHVIPDHEPDREGVYDASRINIIESAGSGAASHNILFSRKGGMFHVESRVTPVSGGDGKMYGNVLSFRNISREYQLNRSLAESEELFRTLAVSSPVAVMMYQKNKWVYANPAATEVTGYEESELDNMDFWSIVHPDFEALVKERGQRRQEGREVSNIYEFKIVRKNGLEKWVRLVGTTAVFRGAPAGLISVIDIDGSKRAAAELIREKELAQRYLNVVEVMIMDLTAGLEIKMINPKGCEILEADEKDILGKNLIESFVPEEIRDDERKFMRDYLRDDGHAPAYRKSLLLTARGNIRDIEWHMTVVRDKTDKWLLCSGSDITERRKLEAQLIQSEKFDSIGLLAGGIAHDFNNMLTGILGGAEILKLKIQEPSAVKNIEMIGSAAQRAAELTRKLLDFSRKGKFESVPVDIHEVINDSIALLERSMDKKVVMKTVLAASAHTVSGDHTQLENAIINLGVNGCDAMPDGGTLTVSTKNITVRHGDETLAEAHEPGEGEYICITVSDTGTGMDEETRKKIFEPFFTTKPPGKGTGFGLPSVYGAVKSHHGTIECESLPGAGTLFHMMLPVIKDHSKTKKHKRIGDHKNRLSVMVIDDEFVTRETAAEIFRELGCTVITAEDGEEGISIYREKKDAIDLILLDMIMPKMNGAEVFTKLKEIDNDVKVALGSGYLLGYDIDDLAYEGFLSFVSKPYDFKKISNLVETLQNTVSEE